MRILCLFFAAGILSGCTIHQQVNPVNGKNIKSVSIIENTKVRGSYLTALETSIRKHGVEPSVVPSGTPTKDYPYVITYTANWAWDLTMYMIYTQITVYENGTEIGSAVYDAAGGGANSKKFINAEEKVDELVTALFEGPAGKITDTAKK
jgi:hypothetical protein